LPSAESLQASLRRFRRELLTLLDGLLDRADHIEGGFRQIIVLAVDNALEALDRILDLDLTPGEPVKVSATSKGCDRKRSILRARATVSLSSSESSSMPRIAMMSWSAL